MFGTSKFSLGLTRRVVIHYLLFSLMAVVCLAICTVAVSQRVLEVRAEGACLSVLERAGSAAGLAYLRNGQEGLQSVVERFHSEGGLSRCAIVSDEGLYLAHWQPAQVGKEAALWEPQPNVSTYQRRLSAGEQPLGTLRVAISRPSFWSTFSYLGGIAPLGVLASLICVAAGALVLKRQIAPLEDVERQLRHVAFTADVSAAQPVSVRSAASMGWNRLAEQLHAQLSDNNLSQRLESALKARTSGHFDDALQSLSDGLAITDMEGRITFANHALSAILGNDCDTAELAGACMNDLLAATKTNAENDEPVDAGLPGRTLVRELQRDVPNGLRTLRAARHPLRQGDNHAGYVWSLRDVTQQKLAAEMRDQFLDSATHELRTPLANIQAYAETLADSETLEVEQQQEFCNIIHSEAARLSRLIDDLLDISSMEVGSLSITRQNVHLDRLLSEVVEKVRPLMDQKSLGFEIMLPGKLPELHLDKDKLAAALVNLLGNAAKYTPSGGRVALKVKVADAQLQIDVEDTGVGVSAEELPQVFEKFFRSADPRVRRETGTGLGLSLAREVVRLHGGDLTAHSELDKGSTFTMTLPLERRRYG